MRRGKDTCRPTNDDQLSFTSKAEEVLVRTRVLTEQKRRGRSKDSDNDAEKVYRKGSDQLKLEE